MIEHFYIKFSSIHFNLFSPYVTLDMSNSVYNPYQDSKNPVYNPYQDSKNPVYKAYQDSKNSVYNTCQD